MRKRTTDINEIKRNISELKGRSLNLSVNKGRKRMENYDGQITDVFPSVFVFRPLAGESMSFSYSDVICGNIIIKFA